jgi:hypothetical protein
MGMTRIQTDRLELVARRSRRTVDDATELWHERAAMREHEGGAARKDAERAALDDVASIVLAPGAFDRRAA